MEYLLTKTFHRLLLNRFSEYRNKNNVSKKAGIGILISDIILKFDLNELTTQSGMIGSPLIQGVFFNNNLNRWQQGLINL